LAAVVTCAWLNQDMLCEMRKATQASEKAATAAQISLAGGAHVPTVFVGMYAPLGVSPSQHFVHAQDRSVIPEIEPPRRGGTTASLLAASPGRA
jgi:hypothetical protein